MNNYIKNLRGRVLDSQKCYKSSVSDVEWTVIALYDVYKAPNHDSRIEKLADVMTDIDQAKFDLLATTCVYALFNSVHDFSTQSAYFGAKGCMAELEKNLYRSRDPLDIQKEILIDWADRQDKDLAKMADLSQAEIMQVFQTEGMKRIREMIGSTNKNS